MKHRIHAFEQWEDSAVAYVEFVEIDAEESTDGLLLTSGEVDPRVNRSVDAPYPPASSAGSPSLSTRT